jgi:hypothetical protein
MTIHGQPETVLQYVVQKLSLVHDSHGIHTGKVLFQWDSLRHVPLSKTYIPNPGRGGTWDYFHGNSIDQDSDGNLIVSARNTWGIYKISVRTGRIMWQVGAEGDSRLKTPWCFQHDASALGDDEYSVFDDGGIGQHCLLGRSWHASRGLIFRVNPAQHPAGVRVVASYSHTPTIHSSYLGSMQRLSDGNVVVGWGDIPQITEYSPSGRVLMDLSLSHNSFRGFRWAWVGKPLYPPAVTAELQGSTTQVWCSWNGATQVVSWRVLAGPAPAKLLAVAGPMHRQGFETHFALGQRYRYVAVQALGASGQVLGTSKAVGTGLG